MAGKMVKCRHCGAEIASGARTCPQCGGKNGKPFYQRPWFIVLIVIVVIAAIGGAAGGGKGGDSQTAAGGGGASQTPEPVQTQEITYTPYDVGTLMDDLDANALKAAETYEGQYVELTGRLNVIDSSGKYISLVPENQDFAIVGVQCYIKSDEQRTAVMDASVGDTLTVRGKITSVGEVLGYSMDMDEIFPAA